MKGTVKKKPLPVKPAPVPPEDASAVDALLRKLQFSPEGVVEAAAEQPRLFMQAVDLRMKAMATHLAAKASYEEIWASAAMHLRREAQEAGDRTTEAGIQNQLTASKEVQLAMRFRNRAEEKDEFCRLLVDAFRMRRDCLKVVGELVGAELGMQRVVAMGNAKMDDLRGKLRQRYSSDGD